MKDTKDIIIGLLNGVGRPGIGNVIQFLKESNFFTATCHSHHRYPGGLADHSLEVSGILAGLPGVSAESAILVGLLHDICSAYHRNCLQFEGHGRRSAGILSHFCHLALTREEREAILMHMHPGRVPKNRLCRSLSHADHLSASRSPKESAAARA